MLCSLCIYQKHTLTALNTVQLSEQHHSTSTIAIHIYRIKLAPNDNDCSSGAAVYYERISLISSRVSIPSASRRRVSASPLIFLPQ